MEVWNIRGRASDGNQVKSSLKKCHNSHLCVVGDLRLDDRHAGEHIGGGARLVERARLVSGLSQ